MSLCFIDAGLVNAASEEGNATEGTVLIFVQPVKFGSALAEIIRENSGLDAIEISDYRELAVMLLMPQIRSVVFGPRMDFLTIPELYRSGILEEIGWFFRNGGGLIGLASAGHRSVTGKLADEVFPLFGNYVELSRFDFGTGRYVLEYRAARSNAISSGVDNLQLVEQEYVVHLNPETLVPEPVMPANGSYSIIYEEPVSGMPLVISYEQQGRSVTFAGLNLVEQEGPGCYGEVVNHDSFRKVFLNALLWVHNNQGYARSMARRDQYFSQLELRNQGLEDLMEFNAEKETRKTTWTNAIRLISTILGAMAIFLIYRSMISDGTVESSSRTEHGI